MRRLANRIAAKERSFSVAEEKVGRWGILGVEGVSGVQTGNQIEELRPLIWCARVDVLPLLGVRGRREVRNETKTEMELEREDLNVKQAWKSRVIEDRAVPDFSSEL